MTDGAKVALAAVILLGTALSAGLASFALGSVVERRVEVAELRKAALAMSLSGEEQARQSALVLSTWADALAAKP